MSDFDLNRRDFTKLTMAALGGIVAGTAAGCAKEEAPSSSAGATTPPAGDAADPAQHIMLSGKNVCRGLNICKNHKGGNNECAGQGACHTVAQHDCGGSHECKGQAGCGDTPGTNTCKTEGGCAVPLMEHAWDKARADFEKAMTAAGKKFGDPPPKS